MLNTDRYLTPGEFEVIELEFLRTVMKSMAVTLPEHQDYYQQGLRLHLAGYAAVLAAELKQTKRLAILFDGLGSVSTQIFIEDHLVETTLGLKGDMRFHTLRSIALPLWGITYSTRMSKDNLWLGTVYDFYPLLERSDDKQIADYISIEGVWN